MAKTFPYLEISGSHVDLGQAIGKNFGEVIKAAITKRRRIIPDYDSYLPKLEPYIEQTQKFFPHLIDEAKALSGAAGIPFLDYFFINCREVFDDYGLPDHCTIAVSFNREGAIVGHNEDWEPEAIDHLYVLKATISDTTFLGLQYMGIPGVSAAMNNWGLVQCINDLSSAVQIGVPKNFLARAILECQTLDEAENLVRTTKSASGFNHVLVQDSQVLNIEICGQDVAVQKVQNAPFVHTNHFISKEFSQKKAIASPSSVSRYQRAKELAVGGMSEEDMIKLLSDTKNRQFPICREKETIGSVVLIPNKREVWVCYGHPCAGEFVRYTL